MSSNRVEARNSDGISLYTMLAAVVVLGILGSVVASQFSGANTKAQVVWSRMQNMALAMKRFHMDTACWPANNAPLLQYELVQGNTSCGDAEIEPSRWDGPYVRYDQGEFGGRYDMFMPQIGPSVIINVYTDRIIVYYGTEVLIDGIEDLCRASKPADLCRRLSLSGGGANRGHRFAYYFRAR